YPPDTSPAVRSVRGCSFYQDAQACAANISLLCNNRSTEILAKYGDGLIKNPYKPHTSTPIADLYSLSYLWTSGLSFGAAVIFTVIGSFALETKDDRLKEVDPKLLFPLKAWLRGFLPGHKFTWDEENDLAVEDEIEMENDPDQTKEDTRL
ncbi:uncharacterized protein LOC110045769, partial [Orbicella faveolata]|uniref:uncharacterized protein LOC110045769 n=1 Tax=Orbicella faveolata TaxID=48498 RepID=UPI0009E54B0A